MSYIVDARWILVDWRNLVDRAMYACASTAKAKRREMWRALMFAPLAQVASAVPDDNRPHVVIACDGRSWRYDVFPSYREGRRLREDKRTVAERRLRAECESYATEALDFLSRTNVTILHDDRLEADDIIAAWTRCYPGVSIVVSSDSDFVQLLSRRHVVLYNPTREYYVDRSGPVKPNGVRVPFELTADGKIKILTAKPEHPPPANFWEMALFLKSFRGDRTDGIPSCLPGVRTKRLIEAWTSRGGDSRKWLDLLSETVETDEGRTSTAELWERNRTLVDLDRAPREILDRARDLVCFPEVRANRAVGVTVTRWLPWKDTHAWRGTVLARLLSTGLESAP